MRKLSVVLLLVVLGYFAYSYFVTSQPQPAPIQEIVTPSPPAGGVWQEFFDPEGQFVVSFPTTPQHASDVVNDPISKERLAFETYLAPGDTQTYYIVTEVVFPPNKKMEAPAIVFENRLKDMLSSNPRNQLTERKETLFRNRPALDVEIANENSLFLNRMFINDHSLYVLTMLHKGKERHDKLFQRFVDSFKLTADRGVKADAKG